MSPVEGTRDGQPPSVDSEIVRLLNTQIVMITSERQALWQYYTAMLVANAIILGSFGWAQAPTVLQVYFASGFGFALCMAWLLVTVSGHKQLSRRFAAMHRFAWDHRPVMNWHTNPMANIDWRDGHQGGWLFAMAIGVIGLFMLAHASLLAHHFYYRFLFFEGPR